MTRLVPVLTAIAARFSALARRHTPQVWLLWALGVLVLAAMPVALVDPPILMLVVDPELLAVIVISLSGLVRAHLRGCKRRGRVSAE